MSNTYKIIFYVPKTHLESVKSALFATGAGRQGNYDQCCWQTLGQGQFRPLTDSQPFIGKQSKAESRIATVAEYRVELLCEAPLLAKALKALKAAHPYEEPAFDVFLRV